MVLRIGQRPEGGPGADGSPASMPPADAARPRAFRGPGGGEGLVPGDRVDEPRASRPASPDEEYVVARERDNSQAKESAVKIVADVR